MQIKTIIYVILIIPKGFELMVKKKNLLLVNGRLDLKEEEARVLEREEIKSESEIYMKER